MNLLLDTHTFIWFFEESVRLPPSVRRALVDGGNACFVSVASLWEIAIKLGVGKLQLPVAFPDGLIAVLTEWEMTLLPVEPEHLTPLVTMPQLHRDPFDRLLVAQARAEGLTLVSGDARLGGYDVPRLW